MDFFDTVQDMDWGSMETMANRLADINDPNVHFTDDIAPPPQPSTIFAVVNPNAVETPQETEKKKAKESEVQNQVRREILNAQGRVKRTEGGKKRTRTRDDDEEPRTTRRKRSSTATATDSSCGPLSLPKKPVQDKDPGSVIVLDENPGSPQSPEEILAAFMTARAKEQEERDRVAAYAKRLDDLYSKKKDVKKKKMEEEQSKMLQRQQLVNDLNKQLGKQTELMAELAAVQQNITTLIAQLHQ